MGILYVEELWDGRSHTGNYKHDRTFTRKFEVRTSSPYDGPLVVRAAMPQYGFPYVTPTESDLGALVVGVDPEQSTDDPTLWYVTVKYDSKLDFAESEQPPGEEGQQNKPEPKERPENPLLRPPVWKFGYQKTTRPLMFDKSAAKKWICNSAGMPFEPPLEEEVSRLTISITINKSSWWADRVKALVNSVNKKKIWNFAERTIKVDGVEATTQYENGCNFFQVAWSLIVNEDEWPGNSDPDFPGGKDDQGGQGWDLKIIDAGYYELGPDPDKAPQKIMDVHGKEAVSPHPLKKDGRRLVLPAEPRWLTFRVHNEVDFKGVIP